MKKVKKTICILLAIMTNITFLPIMDVSASSTMHIPASAKEYKGHMYKVYDEHSVSWDDAEQYCESLGGHLVTVTSAGEKTYVDKLSKKTDGYFWTGAYAKSWITGEKYSYKIKYSSYSDKEYGIIKKGKWYTAKADNIGVSHFICEWDTSRAYTLPEQVQGFKVKKASSSQAILSWKAVDGAKGYAIYMKTGDKGKYKRIGTVNGKNSTAYIKSKLKKGNKYYFRVRAYKIIYGETSYGDLSIEKKLKL